MRRFEIVVLSRDEAEAFTCDRPWAAISVTTEEGDWPDLDEDGRVALLQLAFADVANVDLRYDYDGFTESDAHEIFDFLEDQVGRFEVLLVHCEMGLSRSPAIGAAVARIWQGRGAEHAYFDRWTPNGLVYRTMLEVARRRFGRR